MPNDILGGQGGTLLSAIVIVAVALLALFAVVWLYRRRSPSTFVRGGRARQPRLAVLDAAAVDTRRRIVLIRRDDVEHLVMIGGPTDVVIESRIITADEAAETPAAEARAPAQQSQARREPAPQTSPVADPTRGEPVPQDRIPHNMAQTTAHEPPREAARPQPVPPAPVAATPSPAPRTAAPARSAPRPRAARATAAEPAAAASVAPMVASAGGAAAGAATTLEDEAADILDSARARVFQDQTAATPEQPSGQAVQETRTEPGGDPHPGTGRDSLEAPPIQQQSAPPLGYGEVMSDAEPDGEPGEDLDISPRRVPGADAPVGHPAPAEPRPDAPAEPSIPNFEEVLAAELSGDLALEDFGDPQPETSELGPDTTTVDAEPSITSPTGAPEVQPDTPPSRDSLEDEMARLLGDLTRKS
ncbi:flagellar biosynthetic protein FliO [uncultured Hoeflea sp.]|uniref:flagellar biosynthetic protein FliO n=1 Tax=uncultured Hoeflea sp. TaxID=538666 RepID=UPI002627AA2A|nr:flagellar biosynthetic protein FliO [uncultured Hoeflea sp.]